MPAPVTERNVTRDLAWVEFDGISRWLVADYYRIEECEANDVWLRFRQTNGNLKTLSRHANLDEAKAAAQTHFEDRTRTNLSGESLAALTGERPHV